MVDYLRKVPFHVYRQRRIGKYIVDFYCPKAKLVIELDGSQHFEAEGILYDRHRSAYLEELGLFVVRIPNNEVNRNFEGVCEYLEGIIKQRTE